MQTKRSRVIKQGLLSEQGSEMRNLCLLKKGNSLKTSAVRLQPIGP